MITISIDNDIYLLGEESNWNIFPMNLDDDEFCIRFMKLNQDEDSFDTIVKTFELATSVVRMIKKELAKGEKNISIVADEESDSALLAK